MSKHEDDKHEERPPNIKTRQLYVRKKRPLNIMRRQPNIMKGLRSIAGRQLSKTKRAITKWRAILPLSHMGII